jgi:topoisomerase-4 subunit B
VPVVEIVFTRLHAGGKFDKGAGGAYSFSGGLHGVGVSVTNALAKRLQVTVWREGQVATLTFGGGDVIEPLVVRKAGGGERKHGTSVRVWPDPKYFESAELPRHDLMHLLRSKAVLMPGVTVTLTTRRRRDADLALQGRPARLPDAEPGGRPGDPAVRRRAVRRRGETENFAEGEGAAWCVAFTDEGNTLRESYVNLIPTVAGGTHESGLKDGLFGAIKGFIEMHALLPKGVKLMPDDVFSRASFVLSAKVLDPQFQGQIKERLNSRDALRLVSAYVRPALELWLNQHVDLGKKLAELVIRQAQTRQRASQKVEKRKGSGVAVLPGKLTDCESRDLLHNEVFLVEGDRPAAAPRWAATRRPRPCCRCAARCSTPGRSSATACSPTTRSTTSRWPSASIRTAPTTPRPERPALRQGLHPERCRRGRLAHPGAAADAVLPPLPQADRAGHIYIARPPLFRIDAPARGKRPAAKLYALDEGELDAALDKLRKEGAREGSWSISRFKGLGEMNAEQLWDTTLNPETRRLLPVSWRRRASTPPWPR